MTGHDTKSSVAVSTVMIIVLVVWSPNETAQWTGVRWGSLPERQDRKLFVTQIEAGAD